MHEATTKAATARRAPTDRAGAAGATQRFHGNKADNEYKMAALMANW